MELYRMTIGGVLAYELHSAVHWEDLPAEFRHKIEDLYKDQRSMDIMELFGKGYHRRKNVTNLDLMKREAKRKFNERYRAIEWKADGRRVIDDDYDDLEPAYERKLHTERLKRDNLSEDELAMLVEEDL